jgi:hypothetical protein
MDPANNRHSALSSGWFIASPEKAKGVTPGSLVKLGRSKGAKKKEAQNKCASQRLQADAKRTDH